MDRLSPLLNPVLRLGSVQAPRPIAARRTLELPQSLMSTEGPADPTDIPLLDDGGAIAGDGFGFQHDCIARLCVQMIRDGSVVEVVCETHEDAFVRFADGTSELVSCKTRDPGAPYTFGALFASGGLRRLFKSWLHTERQCRTHLMAEAALATHGDVRDFVACCHSRDETRVSGWDARVAAALDTDEDKAHQFAMGFRITGPETLGVRAHLGSLNTYLLRNWLTESKLGAELDRVCYPLLRDRVARCCRAAIADPLDVVSLVDASARPAESLERARIASRSLDRPAVIAAMLDATLGNPLLAGDPESLDHTRLTAKLARGQVPPQVVSAARRLRASWYEYESAAVIRAPGMKASLSDVRARALLAVADATAALDLVEPYGQEMYRAVREGVTASALAPLSVLGLSDELLLGLVFQATDECELFWSNPYDVDAELK